MIGALLGDFWPYLIAAGGAVAAFVAAYFKGRGDGKAKERAKSTERRLKTIEEVREHARDAETQDDPTLVDRLTRRR